MEHTARLWFDVAGIAAVRGRMQAGHALTRRILAASRTCGEARDAVGALAARALAEADAGAATELADRLLADGPCPQDLGLAHRGLQLAVAHECCAGLWDTGRLDAIRRSAATLVDRLRRGTSSHNPHAVQNNWWAVTHGGIMLAALIAGRDEDARWALGRCLAFSQHFGPAGLYHEGLGYQIYTLTHLLPALAAADRLGMVDLRSACPWITRLAESLYAFTAPRPAVADSERPADGHGMMLSWNDAGLAWLSSNISPLMIAYAEPERRPALAAWSLRLEAGEEADAPLYRSWEGWPFALALPPDAWTAGSATAPLRRHVCDPRQGLAVFRDRWRDGDDTLLGCYARVGHAGGHSHDDGGSVRLMALGHDWIIGGGQARGDARWQSVLAPDGAERRKAGLGAVIWDEELADGGVFAMDLRKVSGAYHERYVALSHAGPCVAMLDLVDDHLDRDWTWRITHAADLAMAGDADGCGFALRAADGTYARFRFLGQAPAAIRSERTPASSRTFSNGDRVAYPSRPVIAAAFPRRPHLAVLVAVAIGRGDVPAPSLADGVDLAIGGRIWRRPFSAAVPADYDLARAGTLSRWADGRRGA